MMMKATLTQRRYPSGGDGMGLSRREALIVSGILVAVMSYLTALFVFV